MKVVFRGNLSEVCGSKVSPIDAGKGWRKFSVWMKYPKSLQLKCGSEVRLGHISFANTGQKVEIKKDIRADLDGVSLRRVDSIKKHFMSDSQSCYLAWQCSNIDSVKHFRISAQA